jgi:hypothetical protein
LIRKATPIENLSLTCPGSVNTVRITEDVDEIGGYIDIEKRLKNCGPSCSTISTLKQIDAVGISVEVRCNRYGEDTAMTANGSMIGIPVAAKRKRLAPDEIAGIAKQEVAIGRRVRPRICRDDMLAIPICDYSANFVGTANWE